MSDPAPTFLLKEVLEATGGVLISGAPENIFYGISTDSRGVNKGNLFIALKGEKYDGHDFVHKASELGAGGVLVHDENRINSRELSKNVAVIKVSDTLLALGDLAQTWRKKFSIPVIGLTGSSGKTTTKEMMAAIIGQKKNILKTEGNLKNLIGLPQTIFQITKEDEVVILEMGQ